MICLYVLRTFIMCILDCNKHLRIHIYIITLVYCSNFHEAQSTWNLVGGVGADICGGKDLMDTMVWFAVFTQCYIVGPTDTQGRVWNFSSGVEGREGEGLYIINWCIAMSLTKPEAQFHRDDEYTILVEFQPH